jgi:hypothetical protein
VQHTADRRRPERSATAPALVAQLAPGLGRLAQHAGIGDQRCLQAQAARAVDLLDQAVLGHDPERHARRLEQRVVRRDTQFDPQTLPSEPHIQEVFTALATDGARTELIAGDALQLAAQGRQPLVLTERREHLELLAAHLATGSLNRSNPGKQDVLIYDYVDAEVPVLRRMFAKRLRTYRSLGYELLQT